MCSSSDDAHPFPMRVYIYTLRYNPISGGGSHHALGTAVRAMRAAGHSVVLTTFFSNDNDYREEPCEMHEEHFEGGFIALQHRVARVMDENNDADMHVIYGPTLMWGAGMYAGNGAVPVAVTLNNYTPGMGLQSGTSRLHSYKWYLWEKLMGTRYTRKITLATFSSSVIQEQYECFGYRFKKSVVIPDSTEPLPRETTRPSPFPNDPTLFHALFIGRLVAEKGADVFIKAAVGLPSNIHLHVIGSGADEQTLRAFVEKNDLGGQVHLHGRKSREELVAFYRHAHLFVHPCRWPEPFGLVVAEALRWGLPVVATENTGAAWIAGNAGMTIKKGNSDELREKILFFSNDPDARAEYGKRALERARLFDADVISRQFVAELESLAKNR